jgi:hypothetical protein
MIKLKYNWVGLVIAIFLSTFIGITSYNVFISIGLDYIKEIGGDEGRNIAELELSSPSAEVYWMPYFYMFLVVLLFMGFTFLINYLMLKKNAKFVLRIITAVGFSLLCSGLILSSIEPYIARDAVEYGVRQDLNKIFELIGYSDINFVGYLIPLIGVITLAILTVSNPNKDEQTA